MNSPLDIYFKRFTPCVIICPCNKWLSQQVCFKKGEDISVVKNKKRGSIEIHKELVEKEVYSTIEVTIDITSILYTKEEWKEEDGVEL